MPRIFIDSHEVLADSENAVLGDSMTVHEPKPLRGQQHLRKLKRKRRKPALGYELGYELNDDLGFLDMGIGRALAPYKPAALAAPEDDRDEVARLLVLPSRIATGAVKGGIYGAILGSGTTQRRIGGGAIGGAVAFPALTAIANRVKAALAARGNESELAAALIDDAAHVGGATASVIAAGGEAEDGAIAGAAVVVASHVIGWFVGR